MPTKMTRTGFCINGQCEGTKPVNHLGEPLDVCTYVDWCKCICHKKITELYEMTGLPRQIAVNPDYRPKERTYWMPGDDDPMPDEPSLNGDRANVPLDLESAATAPQRPVHAVPTRTFTATPTGRKARGQLEYEVLAVCRDFINGVFDWQECTPKNISEEIGKRNATESPSTGAIVAVWDRWSKLNIAEQAKKPLRFIKFTNGFNGTDSQLENLKLKIKREKKRSKSEMRRGFQAFESRKK